MRLLDLEVRELPRGDRKDKSRLVIGQVLLWDFFAIGLQVVLGGAGEVNYEEGIGFRDQLNWLARGIGGQGGGLTVTGNLGIAVHRGRVSEARGRGVRHGHLLRSLHAVSCVHETDVDCGINARELIGGRSRSGASLLLLRRSGMKSKWIAAANLPPVLWSD